jgi:hypothetical protein
MDFRDKVKQNDEKLRLIFKVNEEVHDAEITGEVSVEVEAAVEEEEEIITLNPSLLYESSDESEAETSNENLDEHPVHPSLAPSTAVTAVTKTTLNTTPPVPPQKVGNGKDKKDIFHCRFCDIVFVDESTCNHHEFNSHDSANPFQCVVCSFWCPEVNCSL